MDPELTEQLNESMRELTTLMAQLNSTLAGTGQTMQTLNTDATAATHKTKQHTSALSDQAKSTSQNTALTDAESEAKKRAAAATEIFKTGMNNAGTALGSFTRALFSGEQGFKKYSDSIGTLGTSLLAFGRGLGPAGLAAGFLAAALGKLAEPVLRQTDNLLKASDTIARMGEANAFSTKQILDMAHAAGITSDHLEQIYGPLSKLGNSFGAMGQGTRDAALNFNQMIVSTTELRNQFKRMGMEDPERIQAQADFIDVMSKSGASLLMLEKTTGGLNKISIDYTKNLYEMANITGQSVEQQKEAQKVAVANVQAQLYMLKLNNELKNAKPNSPEADRDPCRRLRVPRPVEAAGKAR